MKKIFLPLLALSVMTTSCVDDLNQRPVIETDAEAVYNDAANYKRVLAKLYASYVIAGQEMGGGNADLSSNEGHDFLRGYFNLQEAATEEMAATWLTGDDVTDLTYMSWDADDPWVADTYYRAYYTIALCNEFLRHSDDASIAGFTETEQADIKTFRAEARFLRALSYYFVLDLFGQGPYVDETMAVGAFLPDAYTNSQLFEYIESELKAVESELSSRAECEYGRASQGAAWTLLAKLYLNAEVYGAGDHYTDCITYCKKVCGAGYSIESSYAKLFNASNHLRTNEIIFPFVVDAVNTVSWGATTYIVCGECGNSSSQDPAAYGLSSGWGMFRFRGEFVELFKGNESTDSRCMMYTTGQEQWLNKAVDNQEQGYFGEKFSNLNDAGEAASITQAVGADIDFPMFRLADVHLMAAEALLRGGEGYTRSEALALVNDLRRRAYGDDSGNIADGELTLQFILDERARELYWECTRRTDLVRFGLFTGDGYLWQWKGGVVGGRSTDAKYNTYPIPTLELSANPNLTNKNY